jgi:hemin uptake protein HemP
MDTLTREQDNAAEELANSFRTVTSDQIVRPDGSTLVACTGPFKGGRDWMVHLSEDGEELRRLLITRMLDPEEWLAIAHDALTAKAEREAGIRGI